VIEEKSKSNYLNHSVTNGFYMKRNYAVNTAEITAIEQEKLIYGDPYCIERLLVKKGFKAKGYFAPQLLGKLSTWHDRVTGTYHYFQEIGDDNRHRRL
jgi:hypothetical protein